MTKKKLYLVRHGQTELNTQGKVQGWSDSPLTDLGRKQALLVREKLAGLNAAIDLSVSSDLGRAIETMQIASPSAKMLATPQLREISFGLLDGSDGSSIDLESWDRDYEKYQGESIDACLKRVYQSLLQIINTPDVNEALVVSHGFPVASMYQILPKDESRSWSEQELIENGTILEYEYDENGFLLKNIHRIEMMDE